MNDKIHINTKGRYDCNYAVEPTKSRLTKDFTKVTCKNCMRKINKLGRKL